MILLSRSGAKTQGNKPGWPGWPTAAICIGDWKKPCISTEKLGKIKKIPSAANKWKKTPTLIF